MSCNNHVLGCAQDKAYLQISFSPTQTRFTEFVELSPEHFVVVLSILEVNR